MLDHLRFVLVRTSHPGNIGAAARAMRTMGVARLDLVAPARFPDPEATARAAGADDLLATAGRFDTVPEALAGARLVFGLSARRRGVDLETLSPREAAARALAEAPGSVVFLFGNERTGLENEELLPCHARVAIPTVPDFGSLNLAAAVQIMAYELRVAADAAVPAAAPAPMAEALADAVQMEAFHGHLAQALEDIAFHKGRSPRTVLARLRRLFQRARLEQRELRILRGILSEAQRQAALVRKGL